MKEPYITKKEQAKVAAKPRKPSEPRNMNVNIKKIQNGYLVHHTGMTPKGKFVEKMVFSASNPVKIKK